MNKANRLKATIFLLIASVGVGTAVAGCREHRPANAAAPSPAMAPAAAESVQKQMPPLPKRHAAPPRRCSMLAYLVV